MYLVKVDGLVVGTCEFDEIKKFESAGCICVKIIKKNAWQTDNKVL